MDNNTILNELKSILLKIKPSLDTDSVNSTTRLVEDLGLDSLTIMLLSLAIENRFGFRFEGAPDFTTVGEVMEHIAMKTSIINHTSHLDGPVVTTALRPAIIHNLAAKDRFEEKRFGCLSIPERRCLRASLTCRW